MEITQNVDFLHTSGLRLLVRTFRDCTRAFALGGGNNKLRFSKFEDVFTFKL